MARVDGKPKVVNQVYFGFRRVIFWRPLLEEKQLLLPGSRPGTLVYTNLGMGQTVNRCLEQAGLEYLFDSEAVIHSYHQRGADELVHRAFKDFGFEELLFLRFPPNAAFYGMMLLGFFLFEAFKEDVIELVIKDFGSENFPPLSGPLAQQYHLGRLTESTTTRSTQ